MLENSYLETIKFLSKEINYAFRGKSWEDDDRVTKMFSFLREAIYSQIHGVLVEKTKENEEEIRDILRKYVIGYVDKKCGFTYIGALNPLLGKMAQVKQKNSKIKSEYIERYVELYEGFLALAGFRSFKHFCLYMQPCFGENFTLWSDTEDVFSGYFYYANKMVLDGSVQFMEKQLPTGYGKSLSDAFMQAWIFGIDKDNDILKVCGNDKFTEDCFENVSKLMLHERYANVFPYYKQFNCESDLMFKFTSRKALKLAIRGSAKSTNFRIVTKLSDTNGVRAKYLFLDDITQRRDMANIEMHNKDIHSFEHEWFERNYNRNLFYVVASGTTYSQFDLLSFLKMKMGGQDTVQSKINKYTHIGTSDYIRPNGTSVFVCVPLLDYDTDESTYPKKISTQSARKKREDNPTEFWAMDMQRPLPPDTAPFYFSKLRQYTTIPRVGEDKRLDTCVGALDTKRRGKDYLSMPIFAEAQDPNNKDSTVFYLVDWLYDNRPMKDCIPLIVAKIIQHKISRLFVERNTEECIETLLQDKLKEKGYTNCVIEEVYSTEPKDRRIMSAEGDIKSRIIFPQYGMYAQSSDMGKALLNVYGYTYTGQVKHDDAPDSLALFSKRFISSPYDTVGQIFGFRR